MSLSRAVNDWFDDLHGRKEYRRYHEKEQRKSRLTSQFVAILGGLAGAVYIGVCLYYANWEVWYVYVPFIVADASFFALYLLTCSNLWLKRYHDPHGIDPDCVRNVDVFIPVCGEPLDVVEPTIAAAVAIDYERKQVYVLDDGKSDAVKRLAEKYGASYIRRPGHEDRKAGNLNYALARTGGELILALDSDQVAQPDIIKRIAGYFRVQRIAFVQTRQSFKLPEHDPWGNADNVFYEAIQSGKDYDNSAISCGSGVMYRRKALEDVGGFSTWNFVEDLHTSFRLHDKGWHSVYYNVPLTIGTAPEEVVSQTKQRWTWAVDSMRILFWDCPLKHRALTWPQRLQYFHFGYYYITIGVFLPIMIFIVPQWALFSHKFVLTIPPLMYVAARLPYFVLQGISDKLMTNRVVSFKSNQAQASLFAVYFDAIRAALLAKTRVPEYVVTRKHAGHDPFRTRLAKCLPHIVVMAVSLSAIVYGLTTIRNDPWFLAVNTFFATFCFAFLWKFVVLSLWPKLLVK
jgi:cellulose synthase (UDP-forming)